MNANDAQKVEQNKKHCFNDSKSKLICFIIYKIGVY